MNEPLAYTIADAMKVAAVSRTEIYRAANNNQLTIRKRGNRSIILADELRRWLNDLPVAPASRGA